MKHWKDRHFDRFRSIADIIARATKKVPAVTSNSPEQSPPQEIPIKLPETPIAVVEAPEKELLNTKPNSVVRPVFTKAFTAPVSIDEPNETSAEENRPPVASPKPPSKPEFDPLSGLSIDAFLKAVDWECKNEDEIALSEVPDRLQFPGDDAIGPYLRSLPWSKGMDTASSVRKIEMVGPESGPRIIEIGLQSAMMNAFRQTEAPTIEAYLKSVKW